MERISISTELFFGEIATAVPILFNFCRFYPNFQFVPPIVSNISKMCTWSPNRKNQSTFLLVDQKNILTKFNKGKMITLKLTQ